MKTTIVSTNLGAQYEVGRHDLGLYYVRRPGEGFASWVPLRPGSPICMQAKRQGLQ